jgi:RNA polymerase sigma-70 factor (ECF subfamily)
MDYGSTAANELAGLCANAGNQAAWQEFVRRFQRPIARVVLRTGRGWGEPSTSLVDDLVQETFLHLCSDNCALLRDFVSREPDSILGYLKVIATNITHDHFRARASLKRGGGLRRVEGDTDQTEQLPIPESHAKAVEIDLQIAEIERIVQSFAVVDLPERDRTIFWLHYRQGFSAREISEISAFRLTIKGVESSIHRTTNLVRQIVEPKGNLRQSTILKEGR